MNNASSTFYAAAVAFQVAAVVFCALMIRQPRHRPSWAVLMLALLVMLFYRVLGAWEAGTLSTERMQTLGAVLSLVVSVLIFISLFFFQRLSAAERASKATAQQSARERDNAEAALQASLDRMKLALSAGQMGTWEWDVTENRVHWSDEFYTIFGLRRQEYQPNLELMSELVVEEDFPAVLEQIGESLRQGSEYSLDFRIRRSDAQIRWVHCKGLIKRDASDNPILVTGICMDQTDRKMADQAARDHEERFRQLADFIPQLAWMAGTDGSIFWYNQRWYEYTGSTLEQMKGWGWKSAHDPQYVDGVVKRFQLAIATGQDWEDTFPLRRHDGEFRWHLSRAMPFRNAMGEIVLWFGTNTDVTEQRQADEARQRIFDIERAARGEAERVSRIKDEFLATLSHELRTPLNAILGWAQILRAGPPQADDLSQGLETIERNARVQTQLIEDLLDMSRIVSGKLRLDVQKINPVLFIEAAIDTVKPAANAKEIRLEKVLDPGAGPIMGDPGRLQQVVWNLVSNSIKFTPKGGQVSVQLQRVKSHVEISVSDTGQGIEPEFLPRLFERFSQADSSTTREFGGLGLGLSIVKQLAEQHGGSVRVQSAGSGQGATFTIELPRAAFHRGGVDEHAITTPEQQKATADKSLEGVKVLVVDDELDARILLHRVLSSCGATVTVTGSGSEALGSIREQLPDVLVCDIGMPEMDGYELLRHAQALAASKGRRIPAVALTAFARSEDRTRALLAGYLVHVAKPVEPRELIATVAAVAGRTGQVNDAAFAGASNPA